jgi:cytosine/adenosine deaminase-related metal-dependent hydrolase
LTSSEAALVLGPDRDGTVVVTRGERIVDVRRGGAPPELDATSIPCPSAVLTPGQVNAHTHIYSGLAGLGMPPPLRRPQSFVEILERVWWRLDRALDARALRASAQLYAAEALLAGTTSLVDHESPDFMMARSTCSRMREELGLRGCSASARRNGTADWRRRAGD